MKRTLHIEPLPSETNGSTVRRACRIIRRDGAGAAEESILWFALPAGLVYPDDTDCDGYLLTMLMDAMSEGRAVSISGSISADLLSNLDEFQGAWHVWMPDKYQTVPIDVDVVREDRRPVEGAVCAFSGGVDGMFTLWRHARGLVGHRTQGLKFGVFVHGFDIPRADEQAFNTNYRRYSEALAGIGVKLLAPVTNCRDVPRVRWEHTYGLALAGLLVNFKLEAGTGLIGGERNYANPRIAWGSTMLTDHLLGSGEFRMMTDGCTHDRTQKVAAIAGWPDGVRHLRVCWRGGLNDRNCGMCEKCVRTMASFRANGLEVPECLHEPTDLAKAVRGLTLERPTLLTYWEEVCVHAEANAVQDPWLEEARRLTRKYARQNIVKEICGRSAAFNLLFCRPVRWYRRLIRAFADKPAEV
ncbi:MAG TPA: hypothetical protein VMO47_03545 [Rhodothermales bacterium]|nr:hypothetical protein [Rhodothermales bacterium]